MHRFVSRLVAVFVCLAPGLGVLSNANSVGRADEMDCPHCNAALVPTIESEQTNVKSAYLHIIDEQTYNEIRKQNGGGGSFSIDGFSIGGNVNYADFKKEFSRRFKNDQMTREEAISRLRQGLKSEALSAWLECVRDCHDYSQSPGIRARVAYKNDKDVAVLFSWYPDPTAIYPGQVDVSTLIGGRCKTFPQVPAGRALPEGYKLAPNSHFMVHYERTPGEPFFLSATVSNHTTNRIELPVEVDPSKAQPKRIQIDLDLLDLTDNAGFFDAGLNRAGFHVVAAAIATGEGKAEVRQVTGELAIPDNRKPGELEVYFGKGARESLPETAPTKTYPINRRIYVSLEPQDEKLRIDVQVVMEQGGRWRTATPLPYFTVIMEKKDGIWMPHNQTTSDVIRGYFGEPSRIAFEGRALYRVSYAR